MGIFSRFATISRVWPLVTLILGLWGGAQSTAWASTMPGADRLRSGVHAGSGPAVGLSWHSTPRTQLGISAATPFFFWDDFGTLRYSSYGLYKLLDQDGFYMAVMMGVYGDLYFPEIERYGWIGLQGGAALAYDLNAQWTLRLNIAPSFLLFIPPTQDRISDADENTETQLTTLGWNQFPPLMGIELAWRPNPKLEATVGFNGNGDILSVSWLWGT